MAKHSCHHKKEGCPGCEEPLTPDWRKKFWDNPNRQKVYSIILLARYEAAMREMEERISRVGALVINASADNPENMAVQAVAGSVLGAIREPEQVETLTIPLKDPLNPGKDIFEYWRKQGDDEV